MIKAQQQDKLMWVIICMKMHVYVCVCMVRGWQGSLEGGGGKELGLVVQN